MILRIREWSFWGFFGLRFFEVLWIGDFMVCLWLLKSVRGLLFGFLCFDFFEDDSELLEFLLSEVSCICYGLIRFWIDLNCCLMIFV